VTFHVIEGGKGGEKSPSAPSTLSNGCDATRWEAGDAMMEAGLQKIIAAHPLDSDCPDTLILQAERRAVAIIAFEDGQPKGADFVDYSDDMGTRLGEAVDACYDLIADTQADTFAAMAAKLRMICVGVEAGFAPWDGRAVKTLLADLDRMAKGGAA
jgi:hypothetical protein